MKKLGSLLLEQTKGQKDILLLNLKLRSFGEKQDHAFGNLGRKLYPALKEGAQPDLDDDELKTLIAEIEELEKEVHTVGDELAELKKNTAEDRDQIFSEMDTAWESAREAFSGVMKGEEKNDDAHPASGAYTSGTVTAPETEQEHRDQKDKPAE